MLGVVVLKGAVVAGVEIHDDCHDFAEIQLSRPPALTLATLEQTLGIERFKTVAEIVNIAEHFHELAHWDLRVCQADW